MKSLLIENFLIMLSHWIVILWFCWDVICLAALTIDTCAFLVYIFQQSYTFSLLENLVVKVFFFHSHTFPHCLMGGFSEVEHFISKLFYVEHLYLFIVLASRKLKTTRLLSFLSLFTAKTWLQFRHLQHTIDKRSTQTTKVAGTFFKQS